RNTAAVSARSVTRYASRPEGSGSCGRAEQAANSTKPGRMAGLRCLRDMPLPKAHDEIALTLDRLRWLRPHLSGGVWDAGEQSVADRRDELRRDTNVRRLLVVVGKAEQFRFRPAAAEEGDPERQSRGVPG